MPAITHFYNWNECLCLGWMVSAGLCWLYCCSVNAIKLQLAEGWKDNQPLTQ